MARRRAGAPGPRCHFLTSFFVPRLVGEGGAGYSYAAVRRWTSKARVVAAHGGAGGPGLPPPTCVLDCDAIVMPVHLGVHWTLAVVRPAERTVEYCDSMRGRARAVTDALVRWAADEAADTDWGGGGRSDRWTVTHPPVPRQFNGCDCGVFMLRFAEAAGAGRRLEDPGFAQSDMDALRLLVAADLVLGCASPTPGGEGEGGGLNRGADGEVASGSGDEATSGSGDGAASGSDDDAASGLDGESISGSGDGAASSSGGEAASGSGDRAASGSGDEAASGLEGEAASGSEDGAAASGSDLGG